MKRYLYLFILSSLISCDYDQGKIPGRIEHDTHLDTIKKGDTVIIEQDLVLPEDNTDAVDTNETYLLR